MSRCAGRWARFSLPGCWSSSSRQSNISRTPWCGRRVEFAIRLPGRDDENEVLLPVDAKFPQEDYQRLLEAAESGDVDGVAAASQALEARIRQFAATIRSK